MEKDKIKQFMLFGMATLAAFVTLIGLVLLSRLYYGKDNAFERVAEKVADVAIEKELGLPYGTVSIDINDSCHQGTKKQQAKPLMDA